MENEIIINWVTYVRKEEKKRSKRGDGFWYHDIRGVIYNDKDTPLDVYKPFVFPTEADCIKARDKILALYRIKEYCNEQRGEFIPDRSDENQKKWYIYYDNTSKKYFATTDYMCEWHNQIYIEKKEHCEEIIERFKDDLDILFNIKWKK